VGSCSERAANPARELPAPLLTSAILALRFLRFESVSGRER
jgi:hypothetical protein